VGMNWPNQAASPITSLSTIARRWRRTTEQQRSPEQALIGGSADLASGGPDGML